LRKYLDQARELAVKAAHEKAQALAAALGQEIGKAHAIEEVTEPAYQPSANVSTESRSSGRGGLSLAPEQKSVSASVLVSFDLM